MTNICSACNSYFGFLCLWHTRRLLAGLPFELCLYWKAIELYTGGME